jgi:uncharacterized protein YndB with AHSA1/START domain
MNLELEKTIRLKAPPERVWKAITEADELAAWFPNHVDWELRDGAEGWFEWDQHGRYAVRVEAFEPPRYMAWRWAREAEKALDQTDSTLVEWTLTRRDNGGTLLHLRESGFAAEEYRQGNSSGWDTELAELLELLGEPTSTIA